MKEIADLEAKVRVLTARRTLNMRRVSDANLSEMRARKAQAGLEAARRALGDFWGSDDIEHAEAYGELTLQLERARVEQGILRAEMKAEEAQTATYRAIAEPEKEYFFKGGHFTDQVELAALEALADCSVAANVLPRLFVIFAQLYRIKVPGRKKQVLKSAPANGQRVYEERYVLWLPGKTHCKELPALGGELHKLQLAEWLLEDPDGNYCYIADGANSQQKEILGSLLSRRSTETGKLEMMAIDIQEISDKTSEGQAKK